MENELLKLASSQGIWVTLSIFLLFYILKAQEKRDQKQEEREKSYQEIILNLSGRIDLTDGVRSDLEEIKRYVCK